MRILILGGNGMLGHKLVQVLRSKFDVWTTLRGNFSDFQFPDIFDKKKTFGNVEAEKIETVKKIINAVNPEVIFNAVGIIKQLPTSKNVVRTLTVNSIFPHLLAEIAGKNRARLINISTDCVFNGKKGNYTENDYADAEDLYGKSKNLGEVIEGNCLTIRTSIIGRELSTGHSLVEWFLSQNGKEVRGFKNAIYTGFPTVVFAEILSDIILKHRELKGLYHISSEKISKYELLKLINEDFKTNIKIIPDEEFRIDRSLDSTKFRQETGFKPLDWSEMIGRMAEDAEMYKKFEK